jgi:hypothetical protein
LYTPSNSPSHLHSWRPSILPNKSGSHHFYFFFYSFSPPHRAPLLSSLDPSWTPHPSTLRLAQEATPAAGTHPGAAWRTPPLSDPLTPLSPDRLPSPRRRQGEARQGTATQRRSSASPAKSSSVWMRARLRRR